MNKITILDAAMGSELEQRGVPMHKEIWAGLAALEHSDVIQSIHEDNINIGADVITTNTFSTARHCLVPIGYADKVELINKKSVEVALRARDKCKKKDVLIAGSLSNSVIGDVLRNSDDKSMPKTVYTKRHYLLDLDEWREPSRLLETYEEQISILKNEGVDLLLLEMMQSPDLAMPLIKAAAGSGLPVWLGVCVGSKKSSQYIPAFDIPDIVFEESLKQFLTYDFEATLVMHSEFEDVTPALEVIKKHYKGTLGTYPHHGKFVIPNWIYSDVNEDEFIAFNKEWKSMGASIFGTCCGLNYNYLKILRDNLVD